MLCSPNIIKAPLIAVFDYLVAAPEVFKIQTIFYVLNQKESNQIFFVTMAGLWVERVWYFKKPSLVIAIILQMYGTLQLN